MGNKILSIQSKLVYGYVGSNIAELAVQLHGLDIIAFPTVYLAAHTGHQPSYGMRVDQKLFDDLIKGIKSLDVLASVAHIITGYIGSEGIIESSHRFIKEIKEAYPEKLFICDPVMGDNDGLYIDEQLANAIVTKLLPLCDIMTPNHFEFEYIVGKKTRTKKAIAEAIANHPILKEKIVIITSCQLPNIADGKIETLIVQQGVCQSVFADRVEINTTGTGDLFAAIVASQLALGKDTSAAVKQATQVVKQALSYVAEVGLPEMNAKSILQAMAIH